MNDFEEKLRACLKRVVCSVAPGAELRITEIRDRWPLPVDETVARKRSKPERVFSETFRGKIYYSVEIIYSREYMSKYDTKYAGDHPLPAIFTNVFIALGLGHLVVSVCEDLPDRICFPVPKTLEVYKHLPPVEEAKEE